MGFQPVTSAAESFFSQFTLENFGEMHNLRIKTKKKHSNSDLLLGESLPQPHFPDSICINKKSWLQKERKKSLPIESFLLYSKNCRKFFKSIVKVWKRQFCFLEKDLVYFLKKVREPNIFSCNLRKEERKMFFSAEWFLFSYL